MFGAKTVSKSIELIKLALNNGCHASSKTNPYIADQFFTTLFFLDLSYLFSPDIGKASPCFSW